MSTSNHFVARSREPTVIARNDPSDAFKFTCDEEPHMLGPQHDGAPGYVPMHLGQAFEDLEGRRYEIVRKLGWASNSSVWLAKTMREGQEKYVAIKVLTVNYTRGIEKGDLHELEVWRRFRGMRYKFKWEDPDHPGFRHCVEPQVVFTAESAHGSHLCFVTEPFGSTVDGLQLAQPGWTFPLSVVKSITRQTLLALDFLHREIGVVHADVKVGNLLIDLNASHDAWNKYLADHPAETYPARNVPKDLCPDPVITVKSQPLPNMGLQPSLENLEISLGDFGGAVPIDNIARDRLTITPPLLRPPELLLGHPWSTPVDIWAVGIMVFECLTGTLLFQVEPTPELDNDAVHVGRIAEHLGPYPADFLSRCNKRSKYFDGHGNLLRAPKPLQLPDGALETWFANLQAHDTDRETLTEADAAATCAFMRRCLAIEPAARPTAAQLLEDEWLQGQ